jgi:hypothetical protein
MTNAWVEISTSLQIHCRLNILIILIIIHAAVWDGLYRSVNNFQKIIETPLENQENYIAIAKIMKALYAVYS